LSQVQRILTDLPQSTHTHQRLVEQLSQAIANAVTNTEPLPAMTETLTLEEAYRVQLELIRQIAPDGIAGLKAGVTTAAAQKHFGLQHGLLGELYLSGRLDPSDSIVVNPQAVIECEIGIVIDGGGDPVSVGPAIEFAYADFSRPLDASAVNLVAGNLGAYRFIQGSQQPWRSSFSGIRVQLSRDGEVVNEASMLEALGGPEHALPWMLQEATKRGLPIADGMLLMTGTCGRPTAALPGSYVADYGEFGQVSFTVAAGPSS
jgi:2-keto-4-pentenoate hydratase